uniref:RNA-directed DNA polymerase n=1 Tax=Strongyloides papillosus TaxID=174720 RepID=A0A0N5BFS5_STREA
MEKRQSPLYYQPNSQRTREKLLFYLHPKYRTNLKSNLKIPSHISRLRWQTRTIQWTRHNGIKLKNINCEPKRIRAGRLPKEKEKAMKEQLEILLNNDMIEPSRSPYLSRALLVKKKNGEYRFVVDFRELNLQLMKQSNYIPRIEDIMQETIGNKFHTVMDFKSGFHQIPLDTNSKRLASFITHKGIYSYKVMPMGLSGSPDTFQRIVENMMNQVHRSFVYIDDILLTSKDEDEHIKQIEKTFRFMEKYNIKITLEKTEFGKAEIKYLGFMLSENGIRPDPKKVQAIKEKEAPKNDKEVRAFIGMYSFFRRHIQNFAKIADPLHKIVNNYKWTDIEEKAFINLKEALINAATLKPPNPDKQYTIQTDASFQGLGAVLLQDDNPIAFAIRGLKVAEKNYEIMRLEGIAILFALKTFRPYIYGLKTTIITNYKPLLAFLRNKELKNALQRLQTAIMEYDLEIIYQPGNENHTADYLLRKKFNVIAGLKENIIQPEKVEKYYNNSERKMLSSSNTIKTQHGERYIVPEAIKEELLKQYHAHPWGSPGSIWITPYLQLKNRLGKIPTADYPCQSYSVDIMTVTDGLHYLIVIDDFSRFTYIERLWRTNTEQTAKELVKCFTRIEWPERIRTDNGKNFKSRNFTKYIKLFSVEHITTTANIHRSNGRVERIIGLFRQTLRANKHDDQDNALQIAIYVFNNTPQSKTNIIPAQLIKHNPSKSPGIPYYNQNLTGEKKIYL